MNSRFAPRIELPFNAPKVQFMRRQAQFMKSLISIHAEGNSLISTSLKSLYHNQELFSTNIVKYYIGGSSLFD
jgi:hypothetical protein